MSAAADPTAERIRGDITDGTGTTDAPHPSGATDIKGISSIKGTEAIKSTADIAHTSDIEGIADTADSRDTTDSQGSAGAGSRTGRRPGGRGGDGRTAARAERDGPDPRGPWRRGRVVAAGAGAVAFCLAGHSLVPNAGPRLGSLLETFLPWLGVAVPLLAVLALVRRSAVAGIAVVLPAVVWCALFGGALGNRGAPGGDLTVVSHNVGAANTDPAGTARALAATGAQVIALEELSPATAPGYERALAAAYPYHSVQGTVGLWSTYPLRDAEALPIMPWTRAMRAVVETREGPLAVYAVHLASVRVHPVAGFTTDRRNEAAGNLAAVLRAEALPRVVVAGDLNGTTEDRALRPVTAGLRSAHEEAGDGFGFSWPASFPVARIDQILVKGVTPVSARTLPRTGSDHLPVAAALRL